MEAEASGKTMKRGLTGKERALLAGGEADWWLTVRARMARLAHAAPPQSAGDPDAAGDPDSADVVELARLRSQMPRFRELPEYFAWDQLAAEMRANILVGVEAGEVIRPRLRQVPGGWKAGLVFAALALVMVSGYWWQLPGRLASGRALNQAIEQATVLEAIPGTVQWQDHETAFGVMYARESGQQTLSGGQGGVRADYVDQETGQLTVAHVYLD